MASLKSPGLILKKTPFSDSSLILKVFTRESGLITLIAKGAKRPKSKYHGLLDFFTLDQFVYPAKSKSEIHTLMEVGLMRDFPRLKSDPARQSLAHVFLELYLKYVPEPEQSHPHFELLLERLGRIDEAREFDPVLELCDFLLALCAVSGFSPQFSECAQCGRTDLGFRARLDPDLGGPVCATCSGTGGGAGAGSFSARLLRWLTRLQACGPRAGRIPREEEAQAEAFLLAFLGKHAGGSRPMKSLDFYHQMLEPL